MSGPVVTVHNSGLGSHPRDVARFALARHSAGVAAALVFVTATQGGSVRMPGLRMAIDANGASFGYVSNGCIEADVIACAKQAINQRRSLAVAYGRDSGKIDLVLPCGGRIDLLIVPLNAHPSCIDALQAIADSRRQQGTIVLSGKGEFTWQQTPTQTLAHAWQFTVVPKIRLLVAGAGLEALYLVQQAAGADMEAEILSPDEKTIASATALNIPATLIKGLSGVPALAADEATAIALMFHDHHWELNFLADVLTGPAFYIGALGSMRAHEQRRQALAEMGLLPEQIERLHGPIGLIQQLRDPNLLAISVLADITAAFKTRFAGF